MRARRPNGWPGTPQQLLRTHTSRYIDSLATSAEDLTGVDQLNRIDPTAEEPVSGVTSCGG